MLTVQRKSPPAEAAWSLLRGGEGQGQLIETEAVGHFGFMAGQQAVANARFADEGAALWGDSQIDRRFHAFAQNLNPVHACRLGRRDPQDPPLAALDPVFQHDQDRKSVV